jgi:hypothetical protein
MHAPRSLDVSMNKQAGGSTADSLIDVSGSYGHLDCFRHLLPLILRNNAHTYISTVDPGDPLATTWLELALAAMRSLRFRDGVRVRDIAVIGTGGGLDTIGISHLFVPERIVASDIHARALEAARWNIARYAHPAPRCEVRLSDLFHAYPAESRFDLIYENLPNVPDGDELFDGIRAASCYRPAAYRSDPVADRYLLTLHYNCLIEALPHLSPGGRVVCMIGGRVPWNAIADVFARAGYTSTVLHFGIKTQTEPAVVLDGYARAERNGSDPFIYYHPAEACAGILDRHAASVSDGPDRAGILNARLEPYRVSAREALRLHEAGEHVCHSVYAVEGAPAPPSGARE